MEKRLLLAISLSLLVMLVWAGATSKFYHVAKQEVTEIKPQATAELPKTLTPDIKEETENISLEKINLKKQEYVFALPYAVIKEVIFKDYQNYKFSLQQGFWLKDNNLAFKAERLGEEPVFIYEDQNKRITKQFNLHKSNYSIGLDIKIQNLSNSALVIDYPLILSKVNLTTNQLESRFQEVIIAQKQNLLRLNPRRDFYSTEDLRFLAIKDRYFCVIIEPNNSDFRAFINKFNHKEAEVGLTYKKEILPGQEITLNFLIYIGPLQSYTLESSNKGWGAVVNYGTFDSISKLLLKLLEFFHRLVHNWGVAIIMLSLFIYFLLYPLTLKQMRSMKRMQELQPKIEKLRQQYKDNPQRLNKEIMELYKIEKTNPFSGCLPMILQLPIFFALYQALIRSLELKGAGFLWIKDLSEPDRIIMLAKPFPVIGNEVNILPLLMALLMFFQQKISTVNTAGTSQEQQRLMMILFPVLFGFIFYRMPSGLVLYWFINTLLMFIYQSRIKLHHPT
jgi:YidC/Oxa1 family membrane protein insertase